MKNKDRRLKLTARLLETALVLGVFLNACTLGQVNQTPVVEGLVPDEQLSTVVSATGIIVPDHYANLSLNVAGVIDELLVSEGDLVQVGQPLLRLVGGDPENPSPEIQAAIRLRELEVDSAQKALDDLEYQAKVLTLQAEQTLNSTVNQIRDLQYALVELDLPESQQYLRPLTAYDLALQAYQTAEDAFTPYRDADNDSERQKRKDDLDEAKDNYDIAVTRLQLSMALEAAEASRDQARADWIKYHNGPTHDDLLQAVKNLNSAKDNLQAAHFALESLTLVAPFSGTLSEIYVRVGEWASPGLPVMSLADFDSLHIETTDLNEIDMIQITVGDPVQVSFDALPEVMFAGRVSKIANQASLGSGVNYTVIIDMDAPPAGLRWGMSAFVDILPQK